MSKAALKKELISLPKEQLVEQILDLYDRYKSVKEFYEIYLHPHSEKDVVEKYKKVIVDEFYPIRGFGKYRFSVCKKAISDFKALSPSPELLADLMLTLPEMACQSARDFGDMEEQFYMATYNNYSAALKYLKKEDLLAQFQLRCKKCLDNSRYCGYGLGMGLGYLYYEYYEG
jgi:hypothetical protein